MTFIDLIIYILARICSKLILFLLIVRKKMGKSLVAPQSASLGRWCGGGSDVAPMYDSFFSFDEGISQWFISCNQLILLCVMFL